MKTGTGRLDPKQGVQVSLEAQYQGTDLELALEFADANPDFDGIFLHSLQAYFEKNGYLTDGQYTALRNIIEKWHIDEWAEKEGLT